LISDTGTGIPLNVDALNRYSAEGTGIGLVIVRQIVTPTAKYFCSRQLKAPFTIELLKIAVPVVLA
jgi:signal transduction histidine kinase